MNKKIIKIQSAQESNVLDIRFWPTDICNYDCSYCFPNSKDGVYRYPKNVGTVVKNFRKLFDIYNQKFGKDTFLINLVGGGEPTLWPYFKEFCDEIKKHHNVKLQVTSNGSRTLRWWEENTSTIDKVVLSCHHEFVDLKNYIEVADYLHRSGKIVTALVLMDAVHWDKCINIVDTMMTTSKEQWIIETKSVVDSPGHDINSYSQEQLDYIKMALKRVPTSDWLIPRLGFLNPFKSIAMFDDQSIMACKPETHINSRWNNFYNWKCNVTMENLVISYDGSVTGSCQEDLFKDCKLNMFSETFEQEFDQAAFDLAPISCPRVSCSCQPDTHITKSKF
jgi:organic radical activating enzyme